MAISPKQRVSGPAPKGKATTSNDSKNKGGKGTDGAQTSQQPVKKKQKENKTDSAKGGNRSSNPANANPTASSPGEGNNAPPNGAVQPGGQKGNQSPVAPIAKSNQTSVAPTADSSETAATPVDNSKAKEMGKDGSASQMNIAGATMAPLILSGVSSMAGPAIGSAVGSVVGTVTGSTQVGEKARENVVKNNQDFNKFFQDIFEHPVVKGVDIKNSPELKQMELERKQMQDNLPNDPEADPNYPVTSNNSPANSTPAKPSKFTVDNDTSEVKPLEVVQNDYDTVEKLQKVKSELLSLHKKLKPLLEKHEKNEFSLDASIWSTSEEKTGTSAIDASVTDEEKAKVKPDYERFVSLYDGLREQFNKNHQTIHKDSGALYSKLQENEFKAVPEDLDALKTLGDLRHLVDAAGKIINPTTHALEDMSAMFGIEESYWNHQLLMHEAVNEVDALEQLIHPSPDYVGDPNARFLSAQKKYERAWSEVPKSKGGPAESSSQYDFDQYK